MTVRGERGGRRGSDCVGSGVEDRNRGDVRDADAALQACRRVLPVHTGGPGDVEGLRLGREENGVVDAVRNLGHREPAIDPVEVVVEARGHAVGHAGHSHVDLAELARGGIHIPVAVEVVGIIGAFDRAGVGRLPLADALVTVPLRTGFAVAVGVRIRAAALEHEAEVATAALAHRDGRLEGADDTVLALVGCPHRFGRGAVVAELRSAVVDRPVQLDVRAPVGTCLPGELGVGRGEVGVGTPNDAAVGLEGIQLEAVRTRLLERDRERELAQLTDDGTRRGGTSGASRARVPGGTRGTSRTRAARTAARARRRPDTVADQGSADDARLRDRTPGTRLGRRAVAARRTRASARAGRGASRTSGAARAPRGARARTCRTSRATSRTSSRRARASARTCRTSRAVRDALALPIRLDLADLAGVAGDGVADRFLGLTLPRAPRRDATSRTAGTSSRASARATGAGLAGRSSRARRTGRLLGLLGIPVRRIPTACECDEGNDGGGNQRFVKGHLDAPCGTCRSNLSHVLPRLSPE